MEKVVFIVHTEYHLMETIGYITHYFPDSLYDIYVYVVSVKNGGRIKAANLNFDSFNIKVVYVSYEPESYFSLQNKRMLAGIIQLNPNVLIIFNEFHYWKQYLVSKLHKKGCKIILAPDGSHVYSEKIFRIKEELKYQLRFFLINLTNLTFPPFCINRGKYDYAYLKHIDEVWVGNARLFKNRNNHRVKETLSFGEIDSLTNIKRIYNADDLKTTCNCVLYIDQPTDDISRLNEIVDVIKAVAYKTKYPVYVKMHPNSKTSVVDVYKQNGFIILPNNLPAELYIQNLRNSIILSPYSTALFLENQTCRFYWIYSILDYEIKFKIENPTKHIVLANNMAEII